MQAVNGGGFSVDDSANVTLSGSTVIYNIASAYGGAIAQGGISTANVRNSNLNNNQAYFQGGAIRIDSKTNLNIYGSTISSNNVVLGPGGALAITSVSSLVLEQSTLANNKAISGAGIYASEFSVSSMRDSTFSANIAQQVGGAIYCSSGTITSTGTMNFQGNAASSGGGISADPDCSFIGGRQVFSSNTASSNGGAIYSKKGVLRFSDCSFVQNTALGGGGAYFYELLPDNSGFPVSCTTSTATSNSAGYGANAATGPYQLVLGQNTNSQRTVYTDEDVRYNVLVLDKEGNQIKSFSPSIVITMSVEPTTSNMAIPDVIGTSKVELNKQTYIAQFTFKIIGVPRYNYTLQFSAGSLVTLGHVVTILPCRIGEQPEVAGVNKTYCRVCAPGTFRLIPPERVTSEVDEKCQTCLKGVTCDGGTTLLMQLGYWRPDNLTSKIYDCPKTCLQDVKVNGTIVTRCREGHYGPMCMLCYPGYTRTKSECKSNNLLCC